MIVRHTRCHVRGSIRASLVVLVATGWCYAVVPAETLHASQGASPASVPLRRIAFGNCAAQDRPQPIWDSVIGAKPQVFLFLGDNIYGDTADMNVLRSKYAKLGAVPGYRKLRSTCPILATWDDHDFGGNDAGAEFPKKRESQQVFLDFFGVPLNSPRRRREGVYHSQVFGPPGKRVQVIMLDTRYFRSPWKVGTPVGEPGEGSSGRYVRSDDPDATILGARQWTWLEEQLRLSAELRIIASSIQVIPDEPGWEKWANFPHEQERLFQLIQHVSGVLLISGDIHAAEISVMHDRSACYPLLEVTPGSLNMPVSWRNVRNRFREGNVYFGDSFGSITINWDAPDPVVRCQVRNIKGEVVLQHRVRLSELKAR